MRPLTNLGMVRMCLGRADALEPVSRALAILDEVPDAELLRTGPRWEHACALLWSDRLEEATAEWHLLLEDAAATGDEGSMPYTLAHLALTHCLAGEHEEHAVRLGRPAARAAALRCGGLIASRRAASAGELTPSERRVAELVASGRTNREVAAALVLAERTVESHLSHTSTASSGSAPARSSLTASKFRSFHVGASLRYIEAILVPEDEMRLLVFEADSPELALEASARAGIAGGRVLEATGDLDSS